MTGAPLTFHHRLPVNASSDGDGNLSSADITNVSMETAEDDDAMKLFSEVARYVIPLIFGVIAVLGFVGNLLVIVVVVANKQMRSTTNILIISLALADLLFIVVCVPFTAVGFVVPSWPFGRLFCKLYGYVIFVTAHASVYTLVLMSLDRYLAVVHPIRSMTIRSERNAYLAIGLTWLVIGSANSPIFIEYDLIDLPDYEDCVVCQIADYEDHGRVFYGCFFSFGFAIPLTIVSILYGTMIHKLLYGGMPRPNNGIAGTKASEGMRVKRRVTKMVVVVVLIFAVCWLPLQVIFLVTSFGNYPDTIEGIIVKLAFNCLAYMNSCVNPILYAFLSDNFRKSFRKVLGCASGTGFQALKADAERTRDFEKTRDTAGGRLRDMDRARDITQPNAIDGGQDEATCSYHNCDTSL